MRRAKNGSGSEKGKCDSPKIEGGTDFKKCDGGSVVLSYYMALSTDKYYRAVLQVGSKKRNATGQKSQVGYTFF